MLKPSPRQVDALRALRSNTDAVEFLEQILSDTKNRLVTQRDAEVFRQLQGQARIVEDILALVMSDPTQQGGKR